MNDDCYFLTSVMNVKYSSSLNSAIKNNKKFLLKIVSFKSDS